MKPYVSSHLKDMNRQNVYRVLCDLGETSKSQISAVTGISVPTVIKIINFMQEKGLVKEYGEGVSKLGRKPQMLRLNKNRYYSIGVVHEGDYLKVGIANLFKEVIGMKKIRVNDDLDTVLGDILFTQINELLVEHEVRISDVLGIGLGIPGIYDVPARKILAAPLIGITEEMDLTPVINRLEDRYHLEVTVENDLNMEVTGEFLALNLTDRNDLIYLSLGTGIGSGIILNGQLRRGSHNMCGEVGYMTFLDDYVAGSQNAGWLESKINLNALREKFGLSFEDGGSMDERELATEYVSISVALCINNMMMCLDCDHISIGGEIMDLLGEGLFQAIKGKLERLSVSKVYLHQKASKEPGILGAAGMVQNKSLERILAD